MNKNIIKKILNEYDKKRDKAILNQKMRRQEVYSKIPRLQDIDKKITEASISISKVIIEDPLSYENKISKLRFQLEELKKEKAILLTENNIPLEYLNVNYKCNKCNDTGYFKNGEKCSCFKQALINESYEMSNLSKMLQKENFNNFNINIFSNNPIEGEDRTPQENMMNILNISEGFVINFDKDNGENLLFYGQTGLGKTFMANCIAKSLLDKGYIVVYQTAFKIMDIIGSHKFNRNNDDIGEKEYSLLFDADLLIIDDLGTEFTNSFTNTEIFNIVNTRLLNGKKMIISTNFSPKEFADTYTDRTFSRIFSNFVPLKFFGDDLRWEA
ncbi:ATP-binding protein [Clostridium sp. D2Q-11]|uniref:ATP-binding protein n=1 Tax=Anaeromonas frigoriresistens TaxID=2683708 RepID=A0A942UZM8_9FIRM|nr:ATP-binding protein [Anaeromonas frigoriresistens]MBS4538497.1 ATP-binding protein [Anaeromonas frigoriresistens]